MVGIKWLVSPFLSVGERMSGGLLQYCSTCVCLVLRINYFFEVQEEERIVGGSVSSNSKYLKYHFSCTASRQHYWWLYLIVL